MIPWYWYNIGTVRLQYIPVILRITRERHPISCPKGRCKECHSWVQIWLKFYHYNCGVCTIASYITMIYWESIVIFYMERHVSVYCMAAGQMPVMSKLQKLEHGFESMSSESQRQLLPPTAVASMLTIQPWPIIHKKMDWYQLNSVTRSPADQNWKIYSR